LCYFFQALDCLAPQGQEDNGEEEVKGANFVVLAAEHPIKIIEKFFFFTKNAKKFKLYFLSTIRTHFYYIKLQIINQILYEWNKSDIIFCAAFFISPFTIAIQE